MKQRTLSEFIEMPIKRDTNFETLFKKAFSQYFGVGLRDIRVYELVICRKCRKVGYAIVKVVRRKCEKKIIGSNDLRYCLVLKRFNVAEKIVDVGFRVINEENIIIDRGLTSQLFIEGICPFCRDEKA